jgi:hypothetical protein
LPLLAVVAEGPLHGAVIVGAEGAAETMWWNGDAEFVRRDAWPTGSPVRSPLSAGGAYVGQGSLARVTVAGAPRTGWPLRPRPEMDAAPAAMAPSPLEARSDQGSDAFPEPRWSPLLNGMMAARQVAGRGPSAVAGTGLFIDLDECCQSEICAVARSRSRAGTWRRAVTHGSVSRLAIYRTGIVAEGDGDPGWSAWQGNRGAGPCCDRIRCPDIAGLIVAGSHLLSDTAGTGPPARGVKFGPRVWRATLYDLTGQMVSAAVVAIPGRGPVDRAIGGGPASGLPRLVAERAGLPTGTSVAGGGGTQKKRWCGARTLHSLV